MSQRRVAWKDGKIEELNVTHDYTDEATPSLSQWCTDILSGCDYENGPVEQQTGAEALTHQKIMLGKMQRR